MSWYVDSEMLIKEVEARPLLYAKTLPEYSNKAMKNKAWEYIAEKLSEDWDNLTNEGKYNRCRDIQAKWKHIRDNFRREYQAQKDVIPGHGAWTRKRKKYRYYDELLFLVPHINNVKTPGNYSTPANVSEQSNEDPLILKIEHSPAGPSTADADCDLTSGNVFETPKGKEKTSSFKNATPETINNEISDTDEDKTFCLSLVQSLKRMDDDNKLLAKIEILNVIRTFTNISRNESPKY